MTFIDFDMKDEQVIYGLTNELKCLYIIEKYQSTNFSIVVVLNTLYEANILYQSLSNYEEDVYLFPMDDFLTSEALAISPELETTRLETLESIVEKKKSIVVTNLMGYLRFLPPIDIYLNSFITLEEGQEIDLNQVIEKLYNIGYQKQSLVTKTGEMAVRGYVIDIFPINESNPVRIELFGDEIESVRYFDIDTQLTIKKIRETKISPNTEFLTNSNNSDSSFKQSDLINYVNPINITDYLKNGSVCYINYSNIKLGYKQLQEDILEYNIYMIYQPRIVFI